MRKCRLITRRRLIAGGALAVTGAAIYGTASQRRSSSISERSRGRALKMPPLIDAVETGRFDLSAQSGSTHFGDGNSTRTIGFNQSYLGPVVRIANGALQPRVSNRLSWPVSSHWHGLVVPGEHDGGPHLPISPGTSWAPEMLIAQDPCTAFFHTHIHGRTAQDVYAGLAGAIHVVDNRDHQRGLPSTYGVDDLTLILQDRRLSPDGQLIYANSMMDIMHGMTGETMVINGQVGATAVVPKSIVRLRLVNASNARIFSLFMSDTRHMHLVATDGGYLARPVAIDKLRLGSGERAEILVDFSSGSQVSLMSESDPNAGMGGMMGRLRGMFDDLTRSGRFEVLAFDIDERLEALVDRIPDAISEEPTNLQETEIANTRRFSLDMGMGSEMMSGSGMMGRFAINGRAFDMATINERIQLGSTEKWIVETNMLAHPFHVHGVSFQVISENGRGPRPESKGWKDTVVVDGETELLIRFTQPAGEATPFMYHCHILEHEDGGMMGQFTVN